MNSLFIECYDTAAWKYCLRLRDTVSPTHLVHVVLTTTSGFMASYIVKFEVFVVVLGTTCRCSCWTKSLQWM